MGSTTSHMNSNILIAHTEKVPLFREVTGVKQALAQHIVATVEDDYLVDIRNSTKKFNKQHCG